MEASEDPKSPVGKKRCLERKRRELMHARFEELEVLLSSVNSRGGGQDVKGRRADKEKILVDACDCIRKREHCLTDLDRMVVTAKKEVFNLKNEKLELRSDKRYLRTEIEQLRNENGQLRAENVHLWQEMRKVRGASCSECDEHGLIHSVIKYASANRGVGCTGTRNEHHRDVFDRRSGAQGRAGPRDEARKRIR